MRRKKWNLIPSGCTLNIKKAIEKQIFSSELNVPVLDDNRTKVRILPLIDKSTTNITSLSNKIKTLIESYRFLK
jgi:hypothetical protein